MSIEAVHADPIVRQAIVVWRLLIDFAHADAELLEQARSSASSAALNFAEASGVGGGRARNQMNIARGSAYECSVACRMLGCAADESIALARLFDAIAEPAGGELPSKLQSVAGE